MCATTLQHRIGKEKKSLGLIQATVSHIVAAHTGHSSQLFPVATGRNAQFLAKGPRWAERIGCTIFLTFSTHGGFDMLRYFLIASLLL